MKQPEPQPNQTPQPLITPTYAAGRDGKRMILIPAGWFWMGSPEWEGTADEQPQHRVYLDAFNISETPVTNAEYKRFVDATGHAVPYREDAWAKPYNWDQVSRAFPPGKEQHSVVLVTWDDADAYARWAGGRLPTEAEWEKAASWDAANERKRRFPWGNDFDRARCNTWESGIHGPCPVGQFPNGASAYGVLDLAGNVWEWCADWYDRGYYQRSPTHNPRGPETGTVRCLRGGSWLYSAANARGANRDRNYPEYRHGVYGFRVVQS